MLIIGVSALLLFTGCSKESTLICTQSDSGVEITLTSKFKGNVVDTIDLAYIMDLPSYSDKQLEAVNKIDYCSLIMTSMSGYENAFENCHQNIENESLAVRTDINVDEISDNAFNKTGSPKATKEELEKQGYTCTLE